MRVLFETSVEVFFKSFVPYYAYACWSPCLFFCFVFSFENDGLFFLCFIVSRCLFYPWPLSFLKPLAVFLLFLFLVRFTSCMFSLKFLCKYFQPRFVLLDVVSLFISSFRFRFPGNIGWLFLCSRIFLLLLAVVFLETHGPVVFQMCPRSFLLPAWDPT